MKLKHDCLPASLQLSLTGFLPTPVPAATTLRRREGDKYRSDATPPTPPSEDEVIDISAGGSPGEKELSGKKD